MRKPLFNIELFSIQDVPVVYYKGEEIKGKVSVSFDWHTKECADDSGKAEIKLKYYKTEDIPIVIDVEHSKENYIKTEKLIKFDEAHSMCGRCGCGYES